MINHPMARLTSAAVRRNPFLRAWVRRNMEDACQQAALACCVIGEPIDVTGKREHHVYQIIEAALRMAAKDAGLYDQQMQERGLHGYRNDGDVVACFHNLIAYPAGRHGLDDQETGA